MSVPPASTVGRLVGHSAVRFTITGVLSFGVDFFTLFLLHGVFRVWLGLATAMAYCVSFVVTFTLNRTWSFGSDGAVGGQVYRYTLLVLANLATNVAAVTGLVHGLGVQYLTAKVITTGSLSVVNYFASRHWVFATGSADVRTIGSNAA